MNILNKIIDHKKLQLANPVVTILQLKQSPFYNRETLSLKQSLLNENKTGIIAEFKKKSPSKGIINNAADVETITRAYAEHGASGISVLTDEFFFGGLNKDLIIARTNNIPILRKDFIIDEYQVTETKAIGTDVILLIAACLTPLRVKELAAFAKTLQLEVLLEIHNEEELAHICDDIDLVGVNNRDLKTFVVDTNKSIELGKKIPADKIKIAESGINDMQTIDTLKKAGFKGFLMGEYFMKHPDPGNAFADFTKNLAASRCEIS